LDSYLVYQPVPLTGETGTIAFTVQPLWPGSDGNGYVFMDVGTSEAHFILSKDPNNYLRFQAWNGRVESNISFPIADWMRLEPHNVVATWGSGQMRLFVDGYLVATAPLTSADTISPILRVGINEAGTAPCSCVMSDLQVSRETLPSSL
jgi:hypothetical protein